MMLRDRLNDNDRELYDLALSYYSMKSGCLGVLYALSKKGSEERNRHFQAIKEKGGFPDTFTVEGVLTAVVYCAVGAKTFEEAIAKVKEGCDKAIKKSNQKYPNRSLEFERGMVRMIRFSLIALSAWWEKYRPQLPLTLPAEVIDDNS